MKNKDKIIPVMFGSQTIMYVPAGVPVGNIYCVGGGGGKTPDYYRGSFGNGGSVGNPYCACAPGSGGMNYTSESCGGGVISAPAFDCLGRRF